MKVWNVLKSALLCAFAIGLLFSISGCHTAEGFGRDLEETGETIQREVR